MHKGDSASQEDANKAIICANTFAASILLPFASKLGFDLNSNGCWNSITTGNAQARFAIINPFDTKKRSNNR